MWPQIVSLVWTCEPWADEATLGAVMATEGALEASIVCLPMGRAECKRLGLLEHYPELEPPTWTVSSLGLKRLREWEREHG